jgi:hypothetical protein
MRGVALRNRKPALRVVATRERIKANSKEKGRVGPMGDLIPNIIRKRKGGL